MRGLVVKFSGIGGGYKLSPSLLLNFPWTLQKPFYPNYPLCGIVEELRRVGPPEDGCMWDRIRNVFATKLEHSNRNTMEVPLLKALFAAWSEKWTPELALSNDVRTGSVASTSAGVSSVPTLAVASTSAADQTSQPYLKKCKEILAKSKSGYKLSRKSSVYLAILSTFSALPKFATQADQAWARIGKISQELLTPNPTVMEQIAARFYVLEHIRRNSMEQKWVHATWLVCRRIKETDGEVGRQTISKKRKAAKMTDKPLKEAKRLEGQRRGLVHENEELEDPLDSRLGFEVSHPLLPEIARYLVPESRPSNQNKFALKCIDGLLTAGSMKMTLDLHQPIEQQLSSRFSFTKSRLQGKPQSDSRSNEAHENAFWRLCVWPHVMFSAFICPEFSNKWADNKWLLILALGSLVWNSLDEESVWRSVAEGHDYFWDWLTAFEKKEIDSTTETLLDRLVFRFFVLHTLSNSNSFEIPEQGFKWDQDLLKDAWDGTERVRLNIELASQKLSEVATEQFFDFGVFK